MKVILDVCAILASSKKSFFVYYEDRKLWYKTDTGIDFFVDLTDHDTFKRQFKTEEPTITMMRFLRSTAKKGFDYGKN